VKDKYIEPLAVPETPKSSDALYVAPDGEMYLIEFKNGVMDMRKIFDVRLTIFDNLLMLTDIIHEGISYTRRNLNYILVYNEAKNPDLNEEHGRGYQISQSRVEIAWHFIDKKSKGRFVRFKLNKTASSPSRRSMPLTTVTGVRIAAFIRNIKRRYGGCDEPAAAHPYWW
jgi:hypothetical protein